MKGKKKKNNLSTHYEEVQEVKETKP